MGLSIPDPATYTATIARLERKERSGKSKGQGVSLQYLVCIAQRAN